MMLNEKEMVVLPWGPAFCYGWFRLMIPIIRQVVFYQVTNRVIPAACELDNAIVSGYLM